MVRLVVAVSRVFSSLPTEPLSYLFSVRQVYEALTALGSVGWQINKEIHDVVEVAWKKGGSLAGLPECEFLPEVPRPKNRYRLVCRGGQLVCEFAGPSFYEDRDWRNEVRCPSALSTTGL